jgi:hypothetical protein
MINRQIFSYVFLTSGSPSHIIVLELSQHNSKQREVLKQIKFLQIMKINRDIKLIESR